MALRNFYNGSGTAPGHIEAVAGWLEDFAVSHMRRWSVVDSGVEGRSGLFARFQASFQIGVYVDPEGILSRMLDGMRAYEHSKRRSIEPYRRKKKVDYDYGIVIHLHAIGSNVTQIDYETTEEIDALHHLPDELGPHYTAPALPDERGAAGEQFLQYAARRGAL